VYQRTPNWIIARGDRAIGDLEKQLFEENPAMVQADRDHQLAWQDNLLWRVFEMNETAQQFYTDAARAHLEVQITDPELRSKLTPDYPLGCKRILISDDFYPTLEMDHVDLITEPIDRLDAEGIVTRDGTHRRHDVIVWATGFDEIGWHQWVPVKGIDGLELADAWNPTPNAYLGIAVHGFPNFFLVYGPNTNLGHGPITFMLERQAEYIAQAVSHLRESEGVSLDVQGEVVSSYMHELAERLASSAWASPLCSSYYKSVDGTVTKNWMGSMDEYGKRLASFDPSVYSIM
jgi:cation diffusion facilitator CzcD-associated flavoprotein CzcO